MKVKVVGKEYKHGTAKKTGKPYEATIAYVQYPVNGVLGLCCEAVWLDLSFIAPEDVVVGSEYSMDRNRAGFIVAFDRLK